mmetsp:Transcript_5877/g.11784  ORF Transcript_5877/g.11784 Transcript_5877/m.11784 type:complete len:292 (-) Transcript_5877:1190-2065(-)
MGLRATQCRHQALQLQSERATDSVPLGHLGHLGGTPPPRPGRGRLREVLPRGFCGVNDLQEIARAPPHELQQLIIQAVVVLLNEASYVVSDISCKVFDDELVPTEPRLTIISVFSLSMLLMEHVQKSPVVRLSTHHAMLLKQNEQTLRLLAYQIDNRLIVLEGDSIYLQALLRVAFFLEDEHLLVELSLQHLVRKVDAKLLKGIELHDLKTKDVEDAYEGRGTYVRRNLVGIVNLLDQVLEQATVCVLDESVDVVYGLLRVERNGRRATPSRSLHSYADVVLQKSWINAEE